MTISEIPSEMAIFFIVNYEEKTPGGMTQGDFWSNYYTYIELCLQVAIKNMLMFFLYKFQKKT